MRPPPTAKIPPEALPRSEAGQLDWLRLARSRRVGPATFIRLIREHGSAAAALDALPRLAAEAGVGGYAAASRTEIDAEWQAAQRAGARPLLLGAPDYPPLLATIPDPPPFLWALGAPALAARPTVALVGARNASALGSRMASWLAAELGGMAASSSPPASPAASTPPRTARRSPPAPSPPRPAASTWSIPPRTPRSPPRSPRRGLRLSEMPMGHDPRPQDFPRRNRIVSGLALGVVVIEGALRSGSLITARNALDQGREVMAVPGNPMDGRAGGCNQLIRDGAVLVRSAADVAEALASALAAPLARPARRAGAAAANPPPARSPPASSASSAPRRCPRISLIRDLALPGADGRRGAARPRARRPHPAPPRRPRQPRGLTPRRRAARLTINPGKHM